MRSAPMLADRANADDQLVTEVEGGKREGSVSMDVLLQVTLPIVLILAFLVVTEVQSLTDQINRLQKDIEGTATGRLASERDMALLELQVQLLYAAATEVGEQAREELGIAAYTTRAPDAADVLAGALAPEFVAAARLLHGALGDESARRRTEDRMREAVEKRFVELVDEETSLAGEPRRRLLDISDANRELFQIKLRGHIESLIDAASAPQLALMLEWLRHPEASQRIAADSLELWREVRDAQGDGSDEAAIEAFIDLKAATLVRELGRLGVPILDRTVLQVDL